jgi:hypothetical protein
MDANNVSKQTYVVAGPVKKGGKAKKVSIINRYGPGNAAISTKK